MTSELIAIAVVVWFQAQSSSDIWQNALFLTALGIIVTILIGIIPLWWTLRDRKRTVISWELVSSTALDRPFRSLPGGMVGTIEIILDGTLVTDVHLVDLKLENAGDYEIRAEDYSAPITIKINEKNGQNATILKAITSDASVYGLDPVIDHFEANAAVVRNTALNKKDSFHAQMLVQQAVQRITADQLEINGRYIGHNAKPIESYQERVSRQRRLSRWRFPFGLAALALGVALTVYSGDNNFALIVGMGFTIMGIIVLLVDLFLDLTAPSR